MDDTLYHILKKSSKIKDLGKSFEIKDLANPLILNEKFFRLKSSTCAAFLRQSGKSTSAKVTYARLRRLSSEKSTVSEKIYFNLFG
jgi:hypothetical protein